MNYKLNDEKMYMDIADGIAVVLDGFSGMYYGLNSFGTAVFEALVKGTDSKSAEVALMNMPGAPADMRDRYEKFLEKLCAYEILVPGPNGMETNFDVSTAASDDFVLEISVYDDAQEMLLADPIHEIDESMGWTPEKESIAYSKEETREREMKVE